MEKNLIRKRNVKKEQGHFQTNRMNGQTQSIRRAGKQPTDKRQQTGQCTVVEIIKSTSTKRKMASGVD